MTGAAAWERMADRYTRLRWVGIGIFLLGLGMLPVRIALVIAGDLPLVPGILPNLATLGISLGAFGTANDTALFALRQLESLGRVPARHAPELATERRRRAERFEATVSAPGVALFLPVLAAALWSWLAWSAWQAA